MYKPLPRYVTVSKSKIHGLGIFSTTTIPPYYILGLSHIKDERFENELIRTPLGGFINHSEHPTCCLMYEEEFIWLQTMQHLIKGDELTVNYKKYHITYLDKQK